jgi:hypothetical protein
VTNARGAEKLLGSKFTLGAEGATLREDLEDNAALYGGKMENRHIVMDGVRPPQAAAKLLALLNWYSLRKHQDWTPVFICCTS